jgi:DNA-binding Lrp family transcriptional regulator
MVDLLDKKIIVELDRNARQPLSRVAKKLRVSKHVVSYRLGQLQKLGVVNGFYTVVDTSKLGYHNYRLYLRFRNASMERRKEIIGSFVEDPATWWVAGTTYPWDVAVILLAQTVAEADGWLRRLLQKFPPEIAAHSLNRYVRLVHFPKDYLVGQKQMESRRQFILGEGPAVEISGLERQILLALSYDARIGTVQLARKLGSTPAVVRYAIRKLEKQQVILGFRLLVDYEKIGYGYHWIHIDAPGGSRKLAEFVKAFPNTVYLDETLGGYSVEFAVHMKKEDSLHRFMEAMLEKFGAEISDYSYFSVVKNHKVVYMPQLP